MQLVELMLSTQTQIATAANETDRAYYENKVAGCDRQMDALVYELYGLTEEEIALVAAK